MAAIFLCFFYDVGLRSRSNFYSWICQSLAREGDMFDVIFIAAGFGFFALAVLYTHVCDQL
ncbi:MAG TPA: hypothetical protein VKB67_08195 [Rhizomicrobium sp.]|nr:hypothetical protein [Rhizomicrobium sp.]